MIIINADGSVVTPVTFDIEFRGDQLTAGNNNSISTWVDNIGANDFLSSTTDRPVQKDSTLNSLPTAEFNGFKHMTLTSTPATVTSFTFIAVMKGTDFSNRSLIGGDGGPQVRLSSGKINLLHGGVADLGSSATTLSTGTWYTVAVTYNGTIARFYVNGATDGTASNTHTMTNPIKYMGARDTNNELMFGNIAHWAFAGSVLDPNVELLNGGGGMSDSMRTLWAHY